jgi:hypothetical protein
MVCQNAVIVLELALLPLFHASAASFGCVKARSTVEKSFVTILPIPSGRKTGASVCRYAISRIAD